MTDFSEYEPFELLARPPKPVAFTEYEKPEPFEWPARLPKPVNLRKLQEKLLKLMVSREPSTERKPGESKSREPEPSEPKPGEIKSSTGRKPEPGETKPSTEPSEPKSERKFLKHKPRRPPLSLPVHHSMRPLVNLLRTKPRREPEPQPEPEPPRPRKKVRKNTQSAAVLCTDSAGMTITNGYVTVSIDHPSNGEVAEELRNFRTRYLTLADERTERRWLDIAKSGLAKNIRAARCRPFAFKACEACRTRECHVWKAAAVMTKVHGFPFNPVPH